MARRKRKETEAEAWARNLRALLAFKRLNDTTVIRPYWRLNVELAKWVRVQRLLQAQGNLSEARYRDLAALGFWSDHAREPPPRGRRSVAPVSEPPPLTAASAPVALDFGALRAAAEDLEPLTSRALGGDRAPELARAWRDRFLQYLDWVERQGHPPPPDRATPLGEWVMSQRVMRKRGALLPGRRRLLEAARFEWSSPRGYEDPRSRSRLDATWELGFQELLAFRQRHGHCAPTPGTASVKLAHWAAVQRREAAVGRLREDRRARLETIGFDWVVPAGGRDDHAWDQMFARLSAFARVHGHCRIPIRTPEDPPLASWVRHQRVLYWKKKLDPARQARLEAIGFAWDQRQDVWEEMFQRLVSFREEFGHATPPARYAADPQLANWCIASRSAQRRGELREDRRLRLEALGFEWELRRGRSPQTSASLLIEFLRREGHFSFEDAPSPERELLAEAAAAVIADRRAGRLDPAEERLLSDAGFPWTTEAREWEGAFARCKALLSDGRGPSPGSSLAGWLQAQRALSDRGALEGTRERRLIQLIEAEKEDQDAASRRSRGSSSGR